MNRDKKIKPSLIVSLVLLAILAVVLFSLNWQTDNSKVMAHHMAPNDYSTTIGNLNIDTVHNGLDMGAMPEAPEIGSGSTNRQLWTVPTPSMP